MAKTQLLLVDGDAKSLSVMEVSLKQAGFSVTTAVNGQDALEKARRAAPDVVLAEVKLRDLDGFELCRQLKADERLGTIPFLFLTAQRATADKIRSLEFGADDYLAKPIYVSEVVTRVRLALQRCEKERLERQGPRGGFQGKLSEVGLADLVQTLEASRKSGTLRLALAAFEPEGVLWFREGKVVDAQWGAHSGEAAFYRLLSHTAGTFSIEFGPQEHPDRIALSSLGLLLEGMRRLDERGQILEQLPPLAAVLELDIANLSPKLPKIPDEVNGLLRLFDGQRSLDAVVRDSPFEELESLRLLSKLYFEGLLRGPAPAAANAAVPAPEPTAPAASPPTIAAQEPEVPAAEPIAPPETVVAPAAEPMVAAAAEPMVAPAAEPMVAAAAEPIQLAFTTPEAPAAPPEPAGEGAAPPIQLTAAQAELVQAHPSPTSVPVTARAPVPLELVHYPSARGKSRRAPSSKAEETDDDDPFDAALNALQANESHEESFFASHPDGAAEPEPFPNAARRVKPWAVVVTVGAVAIAVVAFLGRGQGSSPTPPPARPPTPSAAAAIPAPPPPAPVAPAPATPAPPAPPVPAAPTPTVAATVPPAPPALPPVPTEPAPTPAAAPPPSAPATGDDGYERALAAGEAKHKHGAVRGAIAEFRKAIAARPDSATALAALGDALFEAGDSEAAEKPLRRALALDPRNARACLTLGTLLQTEGDNPGAASMYRQYLEVDPHGSFAGDVRSILKTLH